jgi:hypothetical protein
MHVLMTGLRTAVAALAAGAVLASCSSSKPGGPDRSSHATAPSVNTGAAAVQRYLDAVNALCDALLPKIDAVTHGGSLDIPRAEFFDQLPAHQRLRDRFDRDLAGIAVPPQAHDQAAALADYIRFADELDRKRLQAARQGAAAYRQEIRAELESAAADPSIAARTAAGFHESCNAR